MSLVMDVCEYIYVMDFGRVIFSGTPTEVRESEIVQAAYLGLEEIEEEIQIASGSEDESVRPVS